MPRRLPPPERDVSASEKKALAESLYQARRRIGFTQTEVAKRTGHPDTTISDWERGMRTPTIWALKRLAECYGVSLDMLITGSDSPFAAPNETSGVSSPTTDEISAVKTLLKSARKILKEAPNDPSAPTKALASIEAAEILVTD